jgi:hypothetical protein
MKLDDEDEFNLLDNNNNPNNLSAIESPEKMNLLDGSQTMRPPTPLHLKKNFAHPLESEEMTDKLSRIFLSQAKTRPENAHDS